MKKKSKKPILGLRVITKCSDKDVRMWKFLETFAAKYPVTSKMTVQ